MAMFELWGYPRNGGFIACLDVKFGEAPTWLRAPLNAAGMNRQSAKSRGV